MRYVFRNLHVFVFAFVFVFLALVVAHKPQEAVRYVQPWVEDAVELQDLANAVYREVAQTDWKGASDEALTLFVAAVRMPSLLFERLAEKVEGVEKDMQRGSAVETPEATNQV